MATATATATARRRRSVQRVDLILQDRVALVVGGAGYIGTAVTDRLRTEGATVVVASRTATEGVSLDTADQASVDAAVARVLDEHGRIDVLVVSAAPAAGTLDPDRRSDPDQVASAIDGKALGFLRVANAVCRCSAPPASGGSSSSAARTPTCPATSRPRSGTPRRTSSRRTWPTRPRAPVSR